MNWVTDSGRNCPFRTGWISNVHMDAILVVKLMGLFQSNIRSTYLLLSNWSLLSNAELYHQRIKDIVRIPSRGQYQQMNQTEWSLEVYMVL